MVPRTSLLSRRPLIRLLAINLAIGASVAFLMLGGLLVIDPHGLRGLIFSDRSGGTAIGLLLFGLTITFGSVAMGSAIMSLGKNNSRGGGKARAVPTLATASARLARPTQGSASLSANSTMVLR